MCDLRHHVLHKVILSPASLANAARNEGQLITHLCFLGWVLLDDTCKIAWSTIVFFSFAYISVMIFLLLFYEAEAINLTFLVYFFQDWQTSFGTKAEII